jgi:hypothetical protein
VPDLLVLEATKIHLELHKSTRADLAAGKGLAMNLVVRFIFFILLGSGAQALAAGPAKILDRDKARSAKSLPARSRPSNGRRVGPSVIPRPSCGTL